MRELQLKSMTIIDDFITKTNSISIDSDSVKNVNLNSPNLETIIKNCRLVIMIDGAKTKPRKIILDTKRDNYKSTSPRTKEAGRLFEIVFGNFSLSSKADGFKLHIIKNPAEVIVSKLFNVPYNSMFYDNKALYRKVSPDSGNNQSLSSNSSFNSNCSSNLSPPSSTFAHPLSANSVESVTSNPSLSRSTSRNRPFVSGQYSSTSSLLKEGMKNNSTNFFNENYDICNYRSNVMMSAVLIFTLPDENKAEFEEFIFQYYALLESILNRMATLILDDCHSIYNGGVIDCWRHSKRWIVSILPRHSAGLSTSCSTRSNVHISQSHNNNKWFNVHMFEEVVDYFSKEKRLSFLADVISAVIISNPNASSKYLKTSSHSMDPSYPYLHLLQNLGINIVDHTFNRILVKGLAKNRRMTSPSSWKDRLSTSLNHYKKMWNHQIDGSISCSEINICSRPMPLISESLTKTMSDNFVTDYKEVQLITSLVSDLIRPVWKVAYQPHILPSDLPALSDSKQVKIDGIRSAIEIPLLDDGMVLDQEILPDNIELFFPGIVTDEIVGCLTPLQGYVHTSTGNYLESQLLTEARQSQIIYDNNRHSPDFLVIDVDFSTVTSPSLVGRPCCTDSDPQIQSRSLTLSAWIRDLLNSFAGLIKVEGYDSVIGELYLDSAFANLSQKILSINQTYSKFRTDNDDSNLLALNGFLESDLSLLLRKRSQ